MKIYRDSVLQAIGVRIGDGDHLVVSAIEHYQGFRAKAAVRSAANRNRQHYAKEGKYLTALIHDQIYRLHGGED